MSYAFFAFVKNSENVMYSINRRPLLGGASDSEFEDDLETEVDDLNITIPDEKPFLKPYEPNDNTGCINLEKFIM